MATKVHCDICDEEITNTDYNLVVENKTDNDQRFVEAGRTKVVLIRLSILGKDVDICKRCLRHELIMEREAEREKGL